MPNWCYNTLMVLGESRDLDSFIDQARPEGGDYAESAISLDRLVPIPSNVRDLCEERRILWGTAYEVGDAALVEINDDYIVYEFETQWEPPVAAIKAASARFPALSFELTYKEPLCGIGGTALARDGVVTNSLRSYNLDDAVAEGVIFIPVK